MNKIIVLVSVILITFSCTDKNSLITNKELKTDVNKMFDEQKSLVKGREAQLYNIFDQNLSKSEEEALKFLYAYMPLSDFADFDGDYFLENVKTTLKAKAEMPWGNQIPEDIFLHYVLPIRSGNENIDNFRNVVYDELKQRIQGMSMHDAALEINHWCHEKVNYQPTDGRTGSPLSLIKTSFGRCGEESVFAVAALRTVGIPARQVYTPRWAHTDDNHAWVEVFVDGNWYYMGACEPEPELDMGWFTEPARRAMLVHSRAFGKYFGNEELILNEKRFAELNVTSKYAQTGKVVVIVNDNNGKPVDNSLVQFGLYNYAEFYPIASRYTNEKGIVDFSSGLGDMLISASHNDLGFGFQKIRMGEIDTVKVVLSNDFPRENIVFDAFPPIERTPMKAKVTEEVAKLNSKRLAKEDSIRNAYKSTFPDSLFIENFAINENYNLADIKPLIQNSYGNWNEITDFLKNTKPELKKWAVILLQNISEKDLRDTPKSILEHHLNNSKIDTNETDINKIEIFSKYILNPRIDYEMLSDWREFLQNSFDEDFKRNYNNNENVLINWIKDNITIDNDANRHSRATLSPRGVYELKVSDNNSRNTFYVATARALGHAARVNQETRVPQYYDGNNWINVSFDDSDIEDSPKIERGYVVFNNKTTNLNPKYAIHFTIARLINNVFRTVNLDFDKSINDFDYPIELEAGKYCLTTGNRQPDGSVLSEISFFEIVSNKTQNVDINIRQNMEKILPKFKLENSGVDLVTSKTYDKITLEDLTQKEKTILIWIAPNKEPSNHVLKDIPALNPILEKENSELVFLFSDKNAESQFVKSNFPDLLENSKFILDNNDKLLKLVEKATNRDLKQNFPIIIVLNKDLDVYYFSEGYRVGVGEELGKILLRIN